MCAYEYLLQRHHQDYHNFLKSDFPVYAAEVNLNIACKSYFHILRPFVFAKVISAVAGFGVEITFSNEAI